MGNCEDINATFFEGHQAGTNEYSLKKIRIYEPLGENTFRIHLKSPFHLYTDGDEEIAMEKMNGKFVPWWETITGTYEEQMEEELKKEPSLYQTFKKNWESVKNIAKVVINGNDQDINEFLRK
ncbi:MAG: hypothetical protein KJ646_04920 [Nanoarchaeota archaeon]|nr:hypothetical protein [Nanoarchaeota archaeon]MBU4116527.1 hypothetical protein [Nanoarchaeota archaeon]